MNKHAHTALEALRTLKTLDGRTPGDTDRDVLAAFTGWGPLAPALSMNPGEQWLEAADELDTLLTPPALNVARDVCDTSFFTPRTVTDAVYTLLAATGFTGGRILEPGCGTGLFMSAAPADWQVEWTGIDIDPTATAIAQTLHPEANIITGPLQKTVLRSRSFDAVVGNVPFASSTVHDPSFPASNLHEYFILRALDAVKPGGHVIVVTSRYILDSEQLNEPIFESADLICAVRLPSGTFGGTDVVADILILRRHDAAGQRSARRWELPIVEREGYGGYYRGTYTYREPVRVTVETDGRTTEISGRWAGHEQCIAGTPVATGFDRVPLKVAASDIPAAITAATTAAATYIDWEEQTAAAGEFSDVTLADEDGRKEGSFHLIEGSVHQVTGGKLVPVNRAGAELKALIPLRDAALELIALESCPDRPDEEITPARQAALETYTAYVKKYGPLNRGNLIEGKPDPDTGIPTYSWRRPAMGGFRRDPDYVAVLALEQFDQDTGEAQPAPILLRRVGAHPPKATSAASAAEALAISLGETRQVDLDRIATLLRISREATLTELGGLVFTDPATGQFTPAADYLSGNVRQKLATARAAGPDFGSNVAALEKVMPAELTALDIRPQLGATWIDADDLADFTHEVFGYRAAFTFTPGVAYWETDSRYVNETADARLTYGTPDMSPVALTLCGLNGKAPTVFDEEWDDTRRAWRKVKNQEKTLAAEEKLRDIQTRFATWVWEDKDRADRLVTEYNTRFNSHVTRRSDGSYLTFPGLDERVDLWSHQKDAVDRIVSTDRVIIAHAVGAGKTLSIITGAMKLRQLGLARKPLVAVPSHLLEQIAREAQQAYPTGRFLIATKDDLTRDARRLFAARCATGDWDAVIMTHQAFTSIPVDPVSEAEWLEVQKADLRWHLASEAGGDRGQKQIASAVRKLEERIESLRSGTTDPDAITFEQLGVDHISVDEVHYFRRAHVATRADGFSLGSSKRATDLQVKVETLADRRPGMPVFAGFTGTLLSNTIAECFIWQRLLQPTRLQEAQVEHFDAWAATFVRYETNVEVAPDGSGFRLHRRPSIIQNVPELAGMLLENVDLLSADQLGLERPEATWETIVSTPGAQQATFVASLADRADEIRTVREPRLPDGRIDNMLLVCTDGRRVALDPRLVGLQESSPKVEDAARRIAIHYFEDRNRRFGTSTVPGSLQLVTCDIGTPRDGDSQTYGRLRARLVELGVPAERIRFVHEATTDKARAHLFAQCREGAVSVLLGSTDKVGVGTNIQTRLTALHHLDAPWRPSDVEQREGRALRPKNLSEKVIIYRYVTEGSFDAFMWSALTRKARFITQFYSADGTLRELEDINDTVLSYGEVKALASGNPKLLRQAELSAEVRRLRTVRAVWSQSVGALRKEAKTARSRATGLRRLAEKSAEALTLIADRPAGAPLEELAEEIKRGTHSGYSYGHAWRGLRVEMQRSPIWGKPVVGERTVTVSANYSEVHSFLIPEKVARRPLATILQHVDSALDRWLMELPTLPGTYTDRAAMWQSRASEAERSADTAVFDHEADLTRAETELAELEMEMTLEAAEVTGSLTAA